MKILVLTHEFPPVGGGGGHVAKDLCEGLSSLGHEIKVLTADLIGGVDEANDISEAHYSLIRIPTLRKDLVRANLVAMSSFIVSSVIQGHVLIRHWKPDVIHAHFAVPAGPIAWILSKLHGIPYIITAHLGDVPGGSPEKTTRWFRFIKPFTYPIWQEAKKIIAVSQFTKDLAQKHYPVPIEVIHNGVDTTFFYSEKIEVNNPPIILFAARFVPQKDPLLVIRTLASLVNFEWKLVMIGGGDLFLDTKAEIQKYNLGDRIRLLGWVTPEVVKKEIITSDILFMPSLSEGLPVVGVQALASGLAFVVSDIGGFSDIVEQGKNGFLCDLEDQDSFKNSLQKVLKNKVLLDKFRNQSKEMAKDFDITQIVASYEACFMDVIRNEK